MGIIETIRQRIRGRQGDASFAELEMLLQSLRSCQPQAYYEEAENVMGSSELSVQDSVISKSDIYIENISNLILGAQSLEEDEALEKFLGELHRTESQYRDVLDNLENHSQLTHSLLGDVSAYQMLAGLESSGIAPGSTDALGQEIAALEKERDSLHYSVRKRVEEIDRMRRRYGSFIQAIRNLRKPAGRIELNPRQREVVERGNGPILVTAGPGSGKTTVLEERAVRLVKGGCNPDSILILTFTVKAANAIRNRLYENEDIPTTEPRVFNFHSFCLELVRKYHRKLGFTGPPEHLEGPQLVFYITDHAAEILGDTEGSLSPEMVSGPSFATKLVEFNDLLHNRDCDPVSLLEKLEEGKEDESGEPGNPETDTDSEAGSYLRALIALRKILRKDGFITFGDQITLALRLLEGNPKVVDEVCNHYRHLMVDEFQDNNWPQGKLVELLGRRMESVCVVGDLDQAIYGFRGANVRNTEVFRDSFGKQPNFHSVELDTGYRYSQQLTAIAEKYISSTPGRPERKPLISGIPSRIVTRIECINTPDEVTEADEVAKRIQLLIGAGYRPEEIAVLALSLNYLNYLVSALEQRGVPYTTTSSRSLFHDAAIRDGAMLMKAALDPLNQEMAVRYCMSIPEFCINDLDRLKLNDIAGRANLAEILQGDLPSDLEKPGKAADFAKFLTEHGRDRFGSTREWVQRLFRDSGLTRRLLAQPAESPSFRAFEQLTVILEEFASAECDDRRLADFLDFLQKDGMEMEIDPHRREAAVLLSTIHRAKGLEFPVVFLPQMITRRPVPEDSVRTEILDAIAPEENQKEERELERRRLYFVAMTRAMDRLFLSRPLNLRGPDGTLRPRKAMNFLNEVLDAGRGVIRRVDVTEPVPEFGGTPLLPHSERFRELHLSLTDSLSRLDRSDVEGDIRDSIRRLIDMKLAIAGAEDIVLDETTIELLDQLAELVGGFSMGEIPADEWWPGGLSTPEGELQLSYTAISDYNACPLKFRYKWIEGIRPPVKAVMVSGSNVHRTLEEFTRRHHPAGKLDQLMDIFDEVWAARRYADPEAAEAEKLRCRKIVNQWFEHEQERSDVPSEVEVEKKFRVNIEGVEIIGFVDRVEKYEDGRCELVDFKTGRRDQRPVSSLQLFLYHRGSREDWNEEATDLVIYNLVSGNRFGLGEKMRTSLLERKNLEIETSVRRIKQRQYDPDTSHCRWCDFQHFCDYAGKPVPPTGKVTVADSLVSRTRIEKNADVEGEVLKRDSR